MKKVLLFFLIACSFYSHANAICSGKPDAVYAGTHGPFPNEQTLWVSIPNVGLLPLGRDDDNMAKLRFSLAQTAFIANKTLTIKYYNSSSCAEASQNKAIPSHAGMTE
jgi:hypothetical protein